MCQVPTEDLLQPHLSSPGWAGSANALERWAHGEHMCEKTILAKQVSEEGAEKMVLEKKSVKQMKTKELGVYQHKIFQNFNPACHCFLKKHKNPFSSM